jgi:glycosyltransferase involved in cell wall biosynthesis
LFIIHELAANGAVVALFEQAQVMRAQGHHVTILTPPIEGARAALLARFRAAGIEVTTGIDRSDHDVAIGCTVFAAGSLHDLLGRMPLVWWIHEGRAGVRHVMTDAKATEAFGRIGKLIFPSRGVAERLFASLLGALPPGRAEIIPPIVVQPSPVAPEPKPAGAVRVLSVGSVYPRKRQSDLVQAVAMLRGAAIECVLVGDVFSLDPPADQIVRQEPSRFQLTGGLEPERVHAWHASADIFCLPSADENMPIAPLEAGWHGVPVVLSDLECYEGVWRHGVNALIHPVGDVELLAWYLRMLIESPSLRLRLAVGGRAAAARFGAARSGAAFVAALEEAISEWRAAGQR